MNISGARFLIFFAAILLQWMMGVFVFAEDARGPEAAEFGAATAGTEHVKVEVLQGAYRGHRELLFSFQIADGWHLYYSNPGDTGLPPEVVWKNLPDEFEAGDFLFPVPQIYRLDALVNHGYKNELLLPLILKRAPDRGGLEFTLKWLVCERLCIPEKVNLRVQLEREDDQRFASARAQAEQAMPEPWDLSWGSTQSALGRSGEVALGFRLNAGAEGRSRSKNGAQGDGAEPFFASEPNKVRFLPARGKVFDGSTLDLGFEKNPANEWVLNLKLNPNLTAEKLDLIFSEPIKGLLIESKGRGKLGTALVRSGRAVAVTFPALKTVASSFVKDEGDAFASKGAGLKTPSLPLALVFGFIGGLLLNLMPCVFPVLFLKVFALVKNSGSARSVERVRDALGYSLGSWGSFVAIGGLLMLLRAGGSRVGWGFQLQSPVFVAALVFLLTTLAINFLGWIEWSFAWLTRFGGRWGDGVGPSRSSFFSSFLTGVLAVVVATPCTAPFMGTALGVALSGDGVLGLSVFAAMGLGLAFPFLLVAIFPRLGEHLPRPGAWMERLKKGMALPLGFTVLWLLWVLEKQTSTVAFLLVVSAITTLVAFAAWTFKRNRSVFLWTTIAALLTTLSLVGLIWLPRGFSPAGAPRDGVVDGAPRDGVVDNITVTQGTEQWVPFNSELLDQRRVQGKAVFVDFTAAWCLTCQVNERTVLARAEVLSAFREKDVLLMKADWTEQSPVITEALDSVGRKGVPTYVLYSGSTDARPLVLPELLTVGTILEALNQLR